MRRKSAEELSISLKTYYYLKSVLSSINRDIISKLRNLSRDPNIIITKPDKGSGVVVQNKFDYIEKMNMILQDMISSKSARTIFIEELLNLKIKTTD